MPFGLLNIWNLKWFIILLLILKYIFYSTRILLGDFHFYLSHFLLRYFFTFTQVWQLSTFSTTGPSHLQWLCKVAGYWWELEHAVVHIDPEHPKHDQWVTCLVCVQAMEERGHFQLPGIVYKSFWHGAVHYHVETWGDGGGVMEWQWASRSLHGICVLSNCHR